MSLHSALPRTQLPAAAARPLGCCGGVARGRAAVLSARAPAARRCAPRAHAAEAPGPGSTPRSSSELHALAMEAAAAPVAAAPPAWAPEPWLKAALPVEESSVPPPSWYYDPQFAKLEQKRVFDANWQYAGPRSKLSEPGDYFTGVMGGLGFVVVLDENREVRAYHNLCTHRAAAVATGEGRLEVCGGGNGAVAGLRFQCPYHAWQFDTKGNFRGCKIANGLAGIKNFTPDTSALRPIRVDTWGPLIFLHMGKNELPPVEEVMGAGGVQLEAEGLKSEEWQFLKRVDYPMLCNWKCMVDNYQDGNYHVYEAHTGLIKCFYMDASHNKIWDNMTSMWGPNVPRDEWPPEGQEGGSEEHIMISRTRSGVDQSYSMLHPNIFWNRYGEWFSLTNVTPTSPDTCLTTFDIFFKPKTLQDAAFVAKCLAAEDQLQKEDIELCMRVGENLRNPLYDAGRYAPIETPMWIFHQLLHRDIFGTAPGLKHPLISSNRNFMTKTE